MKVNRIRQEDCLKTMEKMDSGFVDLVVTSPPYDNLRTYKGYSFDFESVARGLFRVVKEGGVIVWVVGDATIKGSETGTSFKQALFFKELGFKLHDTMIWNKKGFSAVGSLKVRYGPVFEYMFVFSKGFLGTFNPIKDRKNKHEGKVLTGTVRQADGSMKPISPTSRKAVPKFGQRFNVWDIPQQQKVNHPAPFPEALVRDHILSWSNEGDLVYDPFMGSGTTAKMALETGRSYVGSEISKEYCDLAKERIKL